MVSRATFDRDGVRLAYVDFGGSGPAVLLVHGLAGHAEEWSATAAWLTERCRVVALDARGHGRSDRSPDDVSAEAHAADAAALIERLELGPAILVGQSLGTRSVMLVAAGRPDLVAGLVVVEGGPAADDEATVEEVTRALESWPVPFASREDAVAFFGGPSPRAEAWVDGLESRDGGLWPRFDVEVMTRTLRAAARSRWEEWERITCPTLIVRAGGGTLPAAEARDMAARMPRAQLTEVPGAGHDLHLDSPQRWRAALEPFLDSVASQQPRG